MSLADIIATRFTEVHPDHAARLLGELPPEAIAAHAGQLAPAAAAAVIDALAPHAGAACLAALAPERSAALVTLLPPGQAAALLRRMPAESREEVLRLAKSGAELRALADYPEGTAGQLMDPQVLALADDLDLDEARRRVQRHAAHVTLEVFLVDRRHALRGVADLRRVLDPASRGMLRELARPIEPIGARADLTVNTAHPGWREHGALPVVDVEGRYLGAVRHQDLRAALEETPAARRSRGGASAMAALGELYWLGLSGVFTGLAGQKPTPEEP